MLWGRNGSSIGTEKGRDPWMGRESGGVEERSTLEITRENTREMRDADFCEFL